jgi:hypothetical protein
LGDVGFDCVRGNDFDDLIEHSQGKGVKNAFTHYGGTCRRMSGIIERSTATRNANPLQAGGKRANKKYQDLSVCF